jgi:site-specific DNA-methyltransferase (adenine-specific)/adenine-specific DNA-methyltransferase
MPTLDWIGKKVVLNHHREVPYRLLRCDNSLSVGDPDAGNLLVQGDNLLALKALLPYYAGKVKCIYIDPPYNTGEQTWAYNDSVNSLEMKKWLGKVVGRETEDLSRHDKWLCMMYPRLKLLVQFLRPDGFLLVSIDEVEVARFRLMMEEIMLPSQFITTLIWKSRRNLDNRSLHNVSVDHEYVVAYRAGDSAFRGRDKDMTKYSNPDNDRRGPWMSDNLVGLATKERRPNLHYDLINPETGHAYSCPQKGWRYSKETMAEKIREGRIIWPASKSGRPRHKKFLADLQNEFAGYSSFIECGNTNEGTEEVSRIMGGEQFIFPKPRTLIEALLRQTASADDLILDSFAGTGTTAHAVLSLNREDGGNRHFILVEMDEQICKKVTCERVARVIKGYTYENRGDLAEVAGLGGGFKYCTLAEPLFDEKGNIHEKVTFPDLATHVFFTETGQPIPKRATGKTPLLGVYNGTAVYLLFNGVLGDKQPNGGNVLTNDVLRNLPAHDGTRVIYGTACRLSPQRLKRENIIFRQTPYEIRTR